MDINGIFSMEERNRKQRSERKRKKETSYSNKKID